MAVSGDLGVVGVAAVAIPVLLAGAPAGRVLLTMAWAGVTVKVIRYRRRRRRRTTLATFSTMRTLIMAGCTVAVASNAAGSGRWVALLAGAILVALLAVEAPLRRGESTRVPVSEHLAGLPPKPPRPNGSPSVVAFSLAALGVGVLVAWLHASPWWWLLACLIAIAPAVLLVAVVRHRRRIARQLQVLVPRAVADYAPDFLVYTSRPDDASYQVAMWLPYLQQTGLRCIVVTRNRIPAQALAKITDVPVIEARGIAQLEALLVPSLKAAFYVNASSGNGELVRHPDLTHVYLGHGDSDKPPSYNPTHAMYDRIFASGPAAVRRYADHGVTIDPDKFRIVGRPQVEVVQPAAQPIGEVDAPVVLYAPTWQGHVEETMLYSLPLGIQIVTALLDRGATVIFRPHPFSYSFPEDREVISAIHRLLAADAGATGRAHLWGRAAQAERGILDCINASDAMVSDVSSVVSDYLFSNKPYTMVAVPAPPDLFVEQYPVARGAYVVRADLSDLGEALDSMLGADPLASRRASIKIDYLGDFPAATYASVFVDAVRAECGAGGHAMDEATDNEEIEATKAEEAEAEALEAGGALEAAEPGEADDARSAASLDSKSWLRIKVPRGTKRELWTAAAATFAGGAAVLAGPAWLVAAAALLTVIVMARSTRTVLSARRRWLELLSRYVIARALLVVPLAALGLAAGLGLVPTAIACALLAVALTSERFLSAASRRPSIVVVDFPAAAPATPPPFSSELQPLVWTGAVLVWAGLALAATAVWLVPAMTAAALLLLITLRVRIPRHNREVEAGDARLGEALLELAPQFAVYFASSAGARYQLGMWLPYFERIGRPYVIVTRNLPMTREIAAATSRAELQVPIIYRPTLRSVEEVIVPSLRTAFYVNNAVRNTHLIERRELVHVWLNHGDSEKPACYNPVHAIYDLIFAAGQAGVDRYARHGVTIPREKFRIVGRPQVEAIEPARGPIAEQQPPTVLYAPTWQGPFADTRLFSLPMGAEIVRHLLDRGVRVVFRAHPLNYRYRDCREMIEAIGHLLAQDRDRTGRDHLWGAAAEQELSIEDCFNLSDAMISDVSAVVSDYLQSEKPFSIVAVGRTPDELVVEAPAARAAYVLREDLSNLSEAVDQLLVADPLVRLRQETRVYYLSDFGDQPYAEGFLRAAREVIDSQTPALPETADAPNVADPHPVVR